MKRLLTVLAILILSSSSLWAQKDFGTLTSIDFTKPLPHNLSLTVELDVRTRWNMNSFERFDETTKINYKPLNWLKLSLAYNPMYYRSTSRGWIVRHRLFFMANESYKVDNWKFSLRERLQFTKACSTPHSPTNPKLYMRLRFETLYDIPNSKVDPFIQIEPYFTLTKQKTNECNFAVGLQYEINKKNTLVLNYRYDDYYNDGDDYDASHMIDLMYSISF